MLRLIDLDQFRSHIAFVRQSELFDGTVLENIRVGRDSIPLDELQSVLSQLNLLDDLLDLPDGLQTQLSGSHSPLSAGQVQRLLLARAIIGKPKLLILDEALENIDAESKNKIIQVLTHPQAPWTLILATHHAFQLSHCQRVVYLKEGRIEKVVSQSLSQEHRS